MKKILTAFCFSWLFFFSSNACEICGCGIGNHYIGLLPQFSHHFFGLRYRFSSFNTRLADDPTEFSKDFYQTVELWGGINIGKRWQVMGFVPYNIVYQHSDEGTTHHNGIGDITLLVNYKLLDKMPAAGHNASQQLWIGGGIKLPVGDFSLDPSEPDLASIANSQVGSGSTDFLLNTHYNIRFRKLGVSSNLSYKINTTNKDGYKFGNRFSANSFAFYPVPAGAVTFLPNAGVLYEQAGLNDLHQSKVELTGGHLLMVAAGTEVNLNKVSLGFNIQLPVAQNFAEGQTKTKLKGMVHMTFGF